MEQNSLNMVKYYNYQEQFKRLKRAIDSEFYLEAIFIEYAIIEDRVEAILLYEHNEINSESHVSIERKIKKILTISREKKSLAKKYFSDDLMEKITVWKDKRNGMIHALMKKQLTTEELKDIALEGKLIARRVCDRANSYKRAVERKNANQLCKI